MPRRNSLESGSARSTRRVRLRTLSPCPEAEHGRQVTQRAGSQVPGEPCGNVSADGLVATVAKCMRIDRVVRGHGSLNPDQVNGGKPASRRSFIVVPGLFNPGPDRIDEVRTAQQPSATSSRQRSSRSSSRGKRPWVAARQKLSKALSAASSSPSTALAHGLVRSLAWASRTRWAK
jgi:hypothetical protein